MDISKEAYNSGLWATSEHHRLDQFPEEEYHLLLAIALIEKHKLDSNPTVRAELRHFISKRLMLEILIIFDVFCYSLSTSLLKSDFVIPGDIGAFSITKNAIFKEEYNEEFNKYRGVTKNMIIETFISQVDKSLLKSDLSYILKVLFSWRIPMVSSFAGFQDGDLPKSPTIFNDDIVARQTQHLAAFLAINIDDYRCSPQGLILRPDGEHFSPLKNPQIFTPRVFQDPLLKNGIHMPDVHYIQK
jgi:hypothetical protein